jgi:glycosyltransferase involved in cell wall biosynthesis
MNVVITTVQTPFVHGGAEALADGLLQALRAAGHSAEIVTVPFKWYPAKIIPEQMLACGLFDITDFNGQRVDKVIGLKFPAYLIPHPDKTIWLLHQHRQAYDLWDHPAGLSHDPMGAHVRTWIQRADHQVFSQCKSVFTIAGNVSKRLRDFCNLESKPLYHPPAGAERFFTGDAGDYVFFPSRITPIKRQSLVIEALARTKHPVRIRFAGKPDTSAYGAELEAQALRLGVAERVEWLGLVSEERKRELYAHCLGVVFAPVDEDYGYITLEAMLAAKPVITCTDSGGPLEFVQQNVTGLIAEPEAGALAEALDRLWLDHPRARRLGADGLGHYDKMNISWSHVVETLLA